MTEALAPLAGVDLDDPIGSVESIHVRIPLSRPVSIALGEITCRDYNICRITTASGITGHGYARGGALVAVAIDECLAPLLGGRPADAISDLWDLMYTSTIQLGRRGAVLRAMSAVDIALWDIRCRRHGLPLWRLLGGVRDRVPCYASGGYYAAGATLDDLRTEVASYAAQGFSAVKIKIGGAPVADDLERIDAVIDAVGEGVAVMVDANTGYENDPATAERVARELSDRGIGWLEEPFGPDNVREAAALRELDLLPIATGEQESTRWGFEILTMLGGADILQPDVTVVGGVSEWLRVAEVGVAHGLPLAPHYFPEVHAQLAGAIEQTIWVEYFLRETEIVNFEDVCARPLHVEGGSIHLDNEPGVGVLLDDEKIETYLVR